MNSGAEVTFHLLPKDPILTDRPEFIEANGKGRFDEHPSLISVQTSKTMGGSAGTFTITMKPGKVDPYDYLLDDDWVDIVFYKYDKKFHSMRGLIDEVRRERMVSGTGATQEVVVVTGRDFQKVFETTPIWFNPFSGENVEGAAALKVFSTFQDVTQIPVPDMVKAFLFNFVKDQGDKGRSNWIPPDTLPGVTAGAGIVDSLTFDPGLFVNDPERVALSFNFLMPNGTAWSIAQEWCDPMFVELYCDLLPIDGGQLAQPTSVNIDESKMHVIVRTRPLPTVAEGANSIYFSLPQWILPRTGIVSESVGRNGFERFNSFFVQPALVQEIIGQGGIDMLQPLWHTDDINKHGLRRFDVISRYTSPKADLLGLSEKQRTNIRDWYALNPYLLSGTIGTGFGAPECRVGHRILIPGDASEDDDLNFYVESVQHDWQFGRGLRTNLGVTRGWKGTDDQYIDALTAMTDGYSSPGRATAGE